MIITLDFTAIDFPGLDAPISVTPKELLGLAKSSLRLAHGDPQLRNQVAMLFTSIAYTIKKDAKATPFDILFADKIIKLLAPMAGN